MSPRGLSIYAEKHVADDLSQYPDFGKPDVMPWEGEQSEPVLWPFGPRAGTPLEDFSSNALVRMRAEVVKKNGRGDYFAPLVLAIDNVLTERQGE